MINLLDKLKSLFAKNVTLNDILRYCRKHDCTIIYGAYPVYMPDKDKRYVEVYKYHKGTCVLNYRIPFDANQKELKTAYKFIKTYIWYEKTNRPI